MDWEKKYNDALERAKRIKNGQAGWGYCDLTEIIPALEEVFPELNEKLKQAITEDVKNLMDGLCEKVKLGYFRP